MPLATALGLTLLAVALLGLDQSHAWPVPLAQWLHVMPALGLGLAMALMVDAPEGGLGRAMGLIILCGAGAWAAGWTAQLDQIVPAALAVLACLALPLRESRASQLAATTALGVYLSHPLVLSVLDRATPVAPQTLTMAALACIGAFALALMIDRLPGLLTSVRTWLRRHVNPA